MTYSTPELLLIGAAENLVMFNNSQPVGCIDSDDPNPDSLSDLQELW